MVCTYVCMHPSIIPKCGRYDGSFAFPGEETEAPFTFPDLVSKVLEWIEQVSQGRVFHLLAQGSCHSTRCTQSLVTWPN